MKVEQIATFLGRQITPRLAQEIGSQFSTRIEGTCIKHRYGKCSIKMYDKAGIVLRIETIANDVSFFQAPPKGACPCEACPCEACPCEGGGRGAEVEHRKGPATRALAPVTKSIYSLIDLHEGALTALCRIDPLRGSILLGCNRRYLAHLSALDDFSAGVRALGRVTNPREVDGHTVKGIKFFEPGDKALL